MKKKLLLSLGLVITSLFVGFSVVNADVTYTSIIYETVLNNEDWGGDPNVNSSKISYTARRDWYNTNQELITSAFIQLQSIYDNEYKDSNPYYVFNLHRHNTYIDFQLIPLSSISDVISYNNSYCPDNLMVQLRYDINSETFSRTNYPNSQFCLFTKGSSTSWVYGMNYFFANFTVRFTDISTTNITYQINDILGNPAFARDSSAPIPQMYDYFELTFLNNYRTDTYTTINLNDYSYVILSFKDYSYLISPTIFDVKGQFCITSAYDYGQQPKETVTDICSVNYIDYTPVRVYTTSSDLQRHVIYYLKAYDTSITNSVKINTSVYNVTPVTSANADSPTIYVGNRPYSPIPYDDLPSTATENTESGYIPGASCGIGDIDCVYETGGLDISYLFTHPLQLLQTVWGSITSVFILITAFIALMPATLQVFLYSSFMLAIILGIIKIIIG